MEFGPIHIDHIGIAVDSLEEGSAFWRLLGLAERNEDELVEDQGVTTRFFSTSLATEQDHPAQVELLEPTGPDTPIGKFISKKGKGVQQICFRVGDLSGMITYLLEHDIHMIDTVPRKGAGGKMIAFVHPKSTGGVLVELTQSS
ncbi:MAG: methylmalonyl-CoA epimerase [Candidatus Poseidoniaceae archaeon]|jgi:methylmalonyl-CoA/ethylmalonyl-CoA epimerase|tara:strand:+ start:55 stop:486 length:432 start_codon:yes stop_codon:yes gene_type:complete